MKYSILVQWSDEDQRYVVILPDWEDAVYQPVTDSATYEEAARKGEDVLTFLIDTFQQEGTPLPPEREALTSTQRGSWGRSSAARSAPGASGRG